MSGVDSIPGIGGPFEGSNSGSPGLCHSGAGGSSAGPETVRPAAQGGGGAPVRVAIRTLAGAHGGGSRRILSSMSLLADARFYVRFLRDPVDRLIALEREPESRRTFVRKGRKVAFLLGRGCNEVILGDPETFHVLPITLPGPEGSAQSRLGAGLVNVNGALHKRHRRMLVPPLASGRLDAYQAPILEAVDELLGRWAVGERRDLLDEMNRLAIRVSAGVLFAIDDERVALRTAASIDDWFKRNTALGVRLFQRDLPGAPYRAMLQAAERLEAEMRGLLGGRRTAQATQRDDLLARLLGARDEGGERLPDDELIGELTIGFVASHETTSKALAWTLFLLAQHPEETRKLLAEIDAVVGTDPPTAEDLSNLPALDRVLQESLRILPPVAFNVRRASRDADVLGCAMPAGSTAVFSHYLTHHDPEVYPDPEHFLPDRWIDLKPPPFAYLPFSAGPRRCIGEAFTTRVQKTLLIRLLQRFRFTLVRGSRFDRHQAVTMAPRQGVPVVLHPPDGHFERVPVEGRIHQMVALRD